MFKNQENVVMLFFISIIVLVGGYALFMRSVIDIIYFMVMLFYFGRFLRIKNS